MSIGMIILAGGVGKRMRKPSPKQFQLLGGKPLIIHALDKISKLPDVSEAVITCPSEFLEDMRLLLKNHRFEDGFRCIEGGDTRQASVNSGLQALRKHDSVMVHEAVRPFVSVEEFQALIDSEHENVTYGSEIPFTVLAGRDFVEGTLQREGLVNVQLPQKFKRDVLVRAHELAIEKDIISTEDASLVFEQTGASVAILPGSEYNIKITYPVDLIIGEVIYEQYILGKGSR